MAEKVLCKRVVIGDPHLKRTDSLGVTDTHGINSRLQDRLDALTFCVHAAITEGATHIDLLGDIFDGINPSEKLKKLFWKTLEPAIQANIHITIILGNHDKTGSSCNLASEEIISRDNITIVSDAPYYEKIGKHTTAFIPYGTKPEIVKWLAEATKKKVDMLFGHFEIVGAIPALDNQTIRHGVEAKTIPGRLKWLGHIHKFQEFSSAFAYIGSLLVSDFGEVDEVKKFGTIEVMENGAINYKYYDIPQRPMIVRYVHEEDTDNMYLTEKIPKELMVTGLLLQIRFRGSKEWVRAINWSKFKKRFKNATIVDRYDEILNADNTLISDEDAAIMATTTMEDRIAKIVRFKDKPPEYTAIGLELYQEIKTQEL